MLPQFFCLANPVDPDNKPEMTGVAGRHSGLRVLEDGGGVRQ